MRAAILTTITMIAFAANSLLCRAALATGSIDPYLFTLIRIGSGAVTLIAIVAISRADRPPAEGSWPSGLALLGYALAFSLAYVTLDAGTGALILFAAVQVTMIVGGLLRGERPPLQKWLGLFVAAGGMVYLVLPGVSAPDPVGAATMILSGVSWGVYSFRGRGSKAPTVATARNFGYALPMAAFASLAGWGAYHLEPRGTLLAIASGALASGLGYALWYRTLREITDTTAAIVQLSVPVIAAVGGIILLGEEASARLIIAGVVTLGGIALASTAKTPRVDT